MSFHLIKHLNISFNKVLQFFSHSVDTCLVMFIPSCFMGFVISVSEYFPHYSSNLLMLACRKTSHIHMLILHLVIWQNFPVCSHSFKMGCKYCIFTVITDKPNPEHHIQMCTHTQTCVHTHAYTSTHEHARYAAERTGSQQALGISALQAECLQGLDICLSSNRIPANSEPQQHTSWLRSSCTLQVTTSVKTSVFLIWVLSQAVISNSTKSKPPFLCHLLDSLVSIPWGARVGPDLLITQP